ncbi:MAG: bifunctional 5,10-methylenetetrahydrofolate dehydrogenase/5,10-methenyltetrahydrofolate cyclohydrolase [bacterium]|nr:bifunctional 5,10-methylenetetrahydrofolate dehydrogenase/5,10-methenyltetrahydrofolate cyclohydrolase [bacterium]
MARPLRFFGRGSRPHAPEARAANPPGDEPIVQTTATILDGRALARELVAGLTQRAEALRNAGNVPRLVVEMVGEDESSLAYARSLLKLGAKIGIEVNLEQMPSDASEKRVIARLSALSTDRTIHGVLLHQPLPPHLDIERIAQHIPESKDVDATHPANQGRLAYGRDPLFVPATPQAVMLLLEASPAWPLRGRRAVVVGRSVVVGLPVSLLLLAADATVTTCHVETHDLAQYTRAAEVLVVATGVPGLVTAEMVAPGATVIDVGTTMVGGVLKGDVAYEEVARVAGAITPVPGGVGPLTNVALMRNVIAAAETGDAYF